MITLESQKLSESRAGPAGVMHGARASARNMCRAALLATGSLSSACADTILRKCSEVVWYLPMWMVTFPGKKQTPRKQCLVHSGILCLLTY